MDSEAAAPEMREVDPKSIPAWTIIRGQNKGISFSLKRFNRIMRWTGFRLFVGFNNDFLESKGQTAPGTTIGIHWHGW